MRVDSKTLDDIIYHHFDIYQRNNDTNDNSVKQSRGKNQLVSSHAIHAAVALQDEIAQFTISNLSESIEHLSLNNASRTESENDSNHRVATAVLRCIDSAMVCINSTAEGRVSKNDCWAEPVHSILELSAAFVCTARNETLARVVFNRVIDFISVERDAIRGESCKILGWCVGHFINSLAPIPSILKANDRGKKRTTKVNSDSIDADWMLACIGQGGNAILPRLTDKSAKVRGAAIIASSSFFSLGGEKLAQISEVILEVQNCIQSSLLWVLSNDVSASNRSLAAECVPITIETTHCIIERVKDVDIKVRDSALETLTEKVLLTNLTEDQLIEVLLHGLTKRCPSTYAKTVKLLCCNWMKQVRYDPIALLEKLNPILNEIECEKAVKVIINVATTLNCQTNVDAYVECVRNNFGAPEIRTFQQAVLKKMSIIEHDGVSELNPCLTFFLRVKCTLATESAALTSGKADTISDIVRDVPTLCSVLTKHLDNITHFKKKEELHDVDDDDAIAFEDGQNFICLQLIHMAQACELQEEGSRRHFISIMLNMLSKLDTPDDLVDAGVKALLSAHDDEAQFLQTISEILVNVEDDDNYFSFRMKNEKDIIIIRQMRIIAILSIVLENISGHMASHPILDVFFDHLSPAITSKNAVVREYGVVCLSKICLLSDEAKVTKQFRPLLMTIVSSVNERAEVRVQAAMALCDLFLIHVSSSTEYDVDSSFEAFKNVLLEMLSHSKPTIVIISAEITAKLLLAGRFHDPIHIAWLVSILFDGSIDDLTEFDCDRFEEKKLGYPGRLKQLLNIFFPTYSMSSYAANDAMMASVRPLLSIVSRKIDGMKQTTALCQYPITKMVEYVCYTVDLADKKKNVIGDADLGAEESVTCPSHLEQNDVKNELNTSNDIIEATSILLASIDIAEFISTNIESTPTFYIKTLAKILGSAYIDVAMEDKTLLLRLKHLVTEAEYAIEDMQTRKAIRKISILLDNVEDEQISEDESQVSTEDEDSEEIYDVTFAMEKVTLDQLVETDKENLHVSSDYVRSDKLCTERNKMSRISLGSLN